MSSNAGSLSQVSTKSTNILLLSLSLPSPPPETAFPGGLPPGSIEAIKSSYGTLVQILDPPRDGFNLTLKVNLSKLPPDEGRQVSFPSHDGYLCTILA